MMNMQNIAMNIIQRNPQIANNPNAQNLLNVIQSGDQKRGEEIANNLCETYGISREDALQKAKQFFNIP